MRHKNTTPRTPKLKRETIRRLTPVPLTDAELGQVAGGEGGPTRYPRFSCRCTQ